MRPRLKMRLGDLLVQDGLITEEQLQQALADQRINGRKLGVTLIDLGLITEQALLEFLAKQLNIPLIDLHDRKIAQTAVNLVPEVQARRHRALVLEADDESALVAMSDPADLAAVDAISNYLQPRKMRLAVVPDSQLLTAFDNLYRRTKDIVQFAKELQTETEEGAEFDLGAMSLDAEADDATVAKLLQSIFTDAVQVRASDIHIEPDEGALRVRMRVVGVLDEDVLTEANIANAWLLRLKLVAGLDISEKRLPQDGRFNIKVRGHSIAVRVSTMPVQHGESCVMRLLDQSAGLLNLEQTGMPPAILERVRHLVTRPYGMFVVTGPTGSGKTTTLYGALSELNNAEVKIITAEDPVEYRLPRITQVQVNPKIGLEFSSILRSALRQDPDIILVGEMRDQETAEIGLRAAMTGHLVLSTLHTNDSISSAMRLIDMGAEPFLVASSLLGVVAQRLVRRVCDNCKETYEPSQQEQIWLQSFDLDPLDMEAGFVKGRGCYQCSNTGYRGRVGVYEMLEMDEDMLDALRRRDVSDFTRAARRSLLFRALGQCAMDYALQGVTSLQEVARVAATSEVTS